MQVSAEGSKRRRPALRAGLGLWLVLVAAILSYSAYFTAQAPCGGWSNEVWGSRMWLESDPGGSYVASAHELFADDLDPLFPGHPGAPLQLLLAVLQRAYYGLEHPDGEAYSEFTARNISRVFFWSKMLMTLLHVLAMFAVFRLATAVLRSDTGALVALLVYATSLPVLYYVSRISVEPLMVAFYAATLLGLFASVRRLRARQLSGGVAMAAFAGAAAASGVVTKFNSLAPLPLFGVAYLLLGARVGVRRRARWGGRLAALGAYLATFGASLLWYSQFINWNEFASAWKPVATGSASVEATVDGGWWETMSRAWEHFGNALAESVSPSMFAPGWNERGVFLLCEGLLLTLGVAGIAGLLRQGGREQRSRGWWLVAYSLYALALWLFRSLLGGTMGSFHYFFLDLVAVCIGFGFYTERYLLRPMRNPTRWRQWAVVLLATAIVHGIAVATAVESRQRDAEAYRSIAAVHETLRALPPGARIGIPPWKGAPDWVSKLRLMRLHGLDDFSAQIVRKSILADAFADLFFRMDLHRYSAEAPYREVPPLGMVVVAPAHIVDRLRAEETPTPRATATPASSPAASESDELQAPRGEEGHAE